MKIIVLFKSNEEIKNVKDFCESNSIDFDDTYVKDGIPLNSLFYAYKMSLLEDQYTELKKVIPQDHIVEMN